MDRDLIVQDVSMADHTLNTNDNVKNKDKEFYEHNNHNNIIEEDDEEEDQK